MFETFLGKIGEGVFILLIALASLFGTVPVQDLGSQLAVGGETYYLSGSGVAATGATLNLTKFGYTKPDGTYQTFSMTNFGTLGCGTLQGGNMSGKQEFISFTGVTQNSDGTAQLTGLSRGLGRFSPYTASTTLQTSHAGGTKFVISNSPPCFYENYVTINNAETITSVKTFSVSPIVPTPVGATEAVNKTYVDGGILAGAATSTESVTGIVRLATLLQTASSTATTANTPYCIQAQSATSTYNSSTAPLRVVVTDNSGKIDGNFIDTTENYSWSGTEIHTGNNTFSSLFATIASTTNATTTNLTVTGNVIGVAKVASTSVWSVDGTWTKPGNAIKVFVQLWGGGGSGGRGVSAASAGSAGGGGGGGYVEKWFNASDLGATETIDIGAGGAAATTNGNGNVGANSTFGSGGTLVTAYGGGAGVGIYDATSATGGAGGGNIALGSPPTPITGSAGAASSAGGLGLLSGGGGAGTPAGTGAGGKAYSGGGGGGAPAGAGGSSVMGGAGGAGNNTDTGCATAGPIPGGGGGAKSYTGGTPSGDSGAGVNGKMIITTFF